MKRSSKIVLIVSALLLALMVFLYAQSQQQPVVMDQARIESMLDKMKQAVAHKNVRALMAFIDQSSDTKVSNLSTDQLRRTLQIAFQQSGDLEANYSKVQMHTSTSETIAEFDLNVVHQLPGASGQDYKGHITLHLQRLDTPHLFGLYHTKDWKIVHADTTGQDLSNWGDYESQ